MPECYWCGHEGGDMHTYSARLVNTEIGTQFEQFDIDVGHLCKTCGEIFERVGRG